MAIQASLTAWIAVPQGDLRPLWIIAGATAATLTAGGAVLNRSGLILRAVGLLGAAYAARLLIDGAPLDPGAAIFGAGLLLSSELAHQVAPLNRRPASGERGLAIERQVALIGTVLAGLAVGSIALLAAAARPSASAVITAIGAVAAAGAVWLIAWTSRTSDRQRTSHDHPA